METIVQDTRSGFDYAVDAAGLPKPVQRDGELTFRVYRHTVALEREEADQIWRRVMDEAERGILLAASELYQGNQTLMARKLGITRTTIRTKLARHGL